MRPNGIKDDRMIWRVRRNFYGLRDGAANLRKKAIKHLIKIGDKFQRQTHVL